jgi:hypothetical protein
VGWAARVGRTVPDPVRYPWYWPPLELLVLLALAERSTSALPDAYLAALLVFFARLERLRDVLSSPLLLLAHLLRQLLELSRVALATLALALFLICHRRVLTRRLYP